MTIISLCTTKEAIAKITHSLKRDNGYRLSWKANIAMAYLDAEKTYRVKHKKKTLNIKDKRIVANEAADLFLDWLYEGKFKNFMSDRIQWYHENNNKIK